MVTKLLSIEEAAGYLSVSPVTVRRFLKSGKLVGRKIGGQWRFDLQELRKAFEEGRLSGSARSTRGAGEAERIEIPHWGRETIDLWRSRLESFLAEHRPEQVVANDRRGAKIWSLLMPPPYEWGANLWHSTAVDLVGTDELKIMFGGKRVLLFDEMIQHGHGMHRFRQRLEAAGAIVISFVCICRKSYLEEGELLDRNVAACEFLDDREYARKATLISQLMMFAAPPLDVDHVIVRGRLNEGVNPVQFFESLTEHGRPFVVRIPDRDADQAFLALTLDRPQFFDTGSVKDRAFSYRWDGPCKIRFYINVATRDCFCSFIVYPRMEGSWSEWVARSATLGIASLVKPDKIRDNGGVVSIQPVYERQCTDFAISLLGDFVASGVAAQCGLEFSETDYLDYAHLRAAFGASHAQEIQSRVASIMAQGRIGATLLLPPQISPPPSFVRDPASLGACTHDIVACRRELLKHLPPRHPRSVEQARIENTGPISYPNVCLALGEFAESAIGRVLDYELDWGTAKPVVALESVGGESGVVAAWRGFFRGEYSPYVETDEETLHGYDDAVIQRTLGISATVVEQFLKRTGMADLAPTHLAKVFANLRHDWRKEHGTLYYFLKPYKYGPIPVVEQLPASGNTVTLEKFLVDNKCLDERRERHVTQIWRRYTPSDAMVTPWRRLYEQRTDGIVKAHVGSLVRFYSAVQKECKTQRPTVPEKTRMSVLADPLIVLGAARNQRIAYVSGRFEFDDWKEKGEIFFTQLRSIAEEERHHSQPILTATLRQFAEPARLLFEKVEMYRNLPFFREQLEKLRDSGNFEIAHFVLESVDEHPTFESISNYPMQTLVWAQDAMRHFTSLTRNILTCCGLDSQKKERDGEDSSEKASSIDSHLAQLLKAAPELTILEKDLKACTIGAKAGVLKKSMAETLTVAFRVVVRAFEANDRRPSASAGHSAMPELVRRGEFATLLLEIKYPNPYFIAVVDVYGFLAMLDIKAGTGSTEEHEIAVFHSFRKEVDGQVASALGDLKSVRPCGGDGDALIFASENVEDLLKAAIRLAQLRIEIFKETYLLGPVRIGVALHDKERGKHFRGMHPGVTAMKIGDRHKRGLGTISITRFVHDHLTAETKELFAQLPEECDQGGVFSFRPPAPQPKTES